MAKFFSQIILGFLGVFFVSCQTPPTKVVESVEYPVVIKEVLISPKTVVLDVRTPLEFDLQHYPGALLVNSPESLMKDPDLLHVASRLSLYGINPEASVVVVGNGIENGTEGSFAVFLKYLGVEYVEVMPFQADQKVNSQIQPNVALWKPKTQEKIYSKTKDTFDLVIDVRDSKAYMKSPNVPYRVMNIPWSEWVDEKGWVNLKTRDRLRSLGIGINDKIFIDSDNPSRAAYVVMMLFKMGYAVPSCVTAH